MSAVPVQKPIVITRPRPDLRVEQGGRVSVASTVGAKAMQFGLMTLCIFLCSSLAGQVMVEKARRDGLKATSRAKDAGKAESLLRAQIQELTSTAAVDAWAQTHGYFAPEVLADPSLVASDKVEAGGAKEAH